MKDTTNKELRLERVSINAWNYERFCGTETWTVIAHVLGTAGNMKEYCYATLYRYEDGTTKLSYSSFADEEDLDRADNPIAYRWWR